MGDQYLQKKKRNGISSDAKKMIPFVLKHVVQKDLNQYDAPNGMLNLELMNTIHTGEFSDEFYSEVLFHSMLTKVIESDHPHKMGTSTER